MGWNGSADKGEAASRRLNKKNYTSAKRQDAASPVKKGLVAGAIVVIGGGLAAWMMMRGETGEIGEKAEIKPSQIAEVKPAKPKAAEEAPKRKKYSEMTNNEKLKHLRDIYGDNPPKNIKQVIYYLENPPEKTFHIKKEKYDIFKHSSEREIAAMLLVEPGTWMMRPTEFDDRFDRDFGKAMESSIEIEKDDDEETQELKRAVIATKAELSERIAAGEKGSQIMTEASKSLYDLGQYRRNLEEQVGDIRRDGSYTDDDVRDIVNAANKMLEEKGLQPLKMPNPMLRRACLKIADRKRKNAETKEK